MRPGRRSGETEGGGDGAQLSLEARLASVAPAGAAARPAVAAAETGDRAGSDAAGPAPAPALPAPSPGPRQRPVLTVAELVRSARQMVEARFPEVRVEGEVSGCKRSGGGHIYFTLKDPDAQLECVMYAREAARLKLALADGMLVRCRGRLTIYEARGRFQLAVTTIEPAGAGALALAFAALKERLAAEGLFDAGRKRPLPFWPRRIGVVTSPTGAVLRDIVQVAHRRCPARILVSPTPVQGDGAAAAIIAALERVALADDIDVVILARGGGSIEDLWAFNDEALARAIARCPVPVVSAVGHETDFTIADFVADLRAPTPSAAAELVLPVAADLAVEIAGLRRRLGGGLRSEVRRWQLDLQRARSALGDPRRLIIDQRRQQIDELGARATRGARRTMARDRTAFTALESRLVRAHPRRRLATQRAALEDLAGRLRRRAAETLATRQSALARAAATIEALSPLRVLKRGYSLALDAHGKPVTSAGRLAPGAALTVTMHDGRAETRVESVTLDGGTSPPPPTESERRKP